MNHDNLVNLLVNDLSPVVPRKSFRFAAIYFLAAALGTLATFLTFGHTRTDMNLILTHPTFLFSTILAAIVSTFGFLSIVYASTPGRSGTRTLVLTSGSLLALLATVLIVWPTHDRSTGISWAAHCTESAVGFGFLSLLTFGWAARKLAPGNPRFVGALCGLASAMVGMTALAFGCPNEHPYHLLLWHMLFPLTIMGVVGAAIGSRFLRW